MQPKITQLVILVVLILSACSPRSGEDETSSSGSSDYINNVGSDTMVNLALAWAEEYQLDNPQSSLSVSGGGSGTGIASLINKTTDIANASRKIKSEEIANAQANGIEPIEFVVARDAIAIIVNPNNPIPISRIVKERRRKSPEELRIFSAVNFISITTLIAISASKDSVLQTNLPKSRIA